MQPDDDDTYVKEWPILAIAAVVVLIIGLFNYRDSGEISDLALTLAGEAFLGLLYFLRDRGKLSNWRWWEIIMALVAIFAGPVVVTWIILKMLGAV